MSDTHSNSRRRIGDDLPMPKAAGMTAPPKAPGLEIDYENLEAHPLANLLPMTDDKKFAELKESIRKHGLEMKLILFSGNQDGTKGALRWLDGRNRRKALKELGIKIEPSMVEVFGGTWEEAKAKVFNLNLVRRQLTSKQLRDIIRGQIAEQIGPAPVGGYSAGQLEEVNQRAISRTVQCSPTTVGSVVEELKQPPELKKYRGWLKTWQTDLSEEHRMLFVRNNAADLRDMLAEIEASKVDRKIA